MLYYMICLVIVSNVIYLPSWKTFHEVSAFPPDKNVDSYRLERYTRKTALVYIYIHIYLFIYLFIDIYSFMFC